MSMLYTEQLPKVQRSWLDKWRDSYKEIDRIYDSTHTALKKVFAKYNLEDSVHGVDSYRKNGIRYLVYRIVWPEPTSDKDINLIGLKMLENLQNTFADDYGCGICVILYADRDCLRFGVADTQEGYDNMGLLICQNEEFKQRHEAQRLEEKRRKEQAMRTFRDRGNKLH